MANAAALFDQAMELSPQDREDLAVQILVSLADGRRPPMGEKEFTAKLTERVEQIERGELDTIDAFEALNQARQRLRSRSE